MYNKARPDQIPAIRDTCNYGAIPFPLIRAVLGGSQCGQVYSANDQSAGVFVLHASGFGYVMIRPDADLDDILALLKNDRGIPQYFHIYDAPERIINAVSAFGTFNVKLRRRKQLRVTEPERCCDAAVDTGVVVRIIDKDNVDDLDIFDTELISRFWRSADEFLERGFGIGIYSGGRPVSVCYSACLEGDVAEIDILTLPGEQGKGYASIAAGCFCNEAIQRGIVPNWDCFEDNAPSLAVAVKTGFTETYSYPFLSVYNTAR